MSARLPTLRSLPEAQVYEFALGSITHLDMASGGSLKGNVWLKMRTETITIHVKPFFRNILRAEALAAQESISALAREWLEERLDLAA